ncbi:hypothetical protein FB567DRAFT_627979 [Paraphoma chrysanthemicola]|uniref:Uncharacterized protein n=1 Tax=Paraphoma chrysanthemicola TaxID=798071 RepID=A0A8K0R6N5_9PLEO|nr:hypothetical protein FB567DRAFT_627979 [Paraphoma chrysanthemicola]
MAFYDRERERRRHQREQYEQEQTKQGNAAADAWGVHAVTEPVSDQPDDDFYLESGEEDFDLDNSDEYDLDWDPCSDRPKKKVKRDQNGDLIKPFCMRDFAASSADVLFFAGDDLDDLHAFGEILELGSINNRSGQLGLGGVTASARRDVLDIYVTLDKEGEMCWLKGANIPVMGEPGFPRAPHVIVSMRDCYKLEYDVTNDKGLGLGHVRKNTVSHEHPRVFQYITKRRDNGTRKDDFVDSHDAGNDAVATLMSFLCCVLKANGADWTTKPLGPSTRPWRIFALDCEGSGARSMTRQFGFAELRSWDVKPGSSFHSWLDAVKVTSLMNAPVQNNLSPYCRPGKPIFVQTHASIGIGVASSKPDLKTIKPALPLRIPATPPSVPTTPVEAPTSVTVADGVMTSSQSIATGVATKHARSPSPVDEEANKVRKVEHDQQDTIMHDASEITSTESTQSNIFRGLFPKYLDKVYRDTLATICPDSLAGNHCRSQIFKNGLAVTPPCTMAHVCPVFQQHVKDAASSACDREHAHTQEGFYGEVLHITPSCKSLSKEDGRPCSVSSCRFGHDEPSARKDGFVRLKVVGVNAEIVFARYKLEERKRSLDKVEERLARDPNNTGLSTKRDKLRQSFN